MYKLHLASAKAIRNEDISNIYNRDYFERGQELGISGYSNYRWLPERTIPSVHCIISKLGIKERRLNGGKGDTVLDFGCAKGYSVKAFRLLMVDCYGCDISEYALSCADESVRIYLKLATKDMIIPFDREFDWLIAKDVLEHIQYERIDETLSEFARKSEDQFLVIPLGWNGKYVIEEYEVDIGHIIREDVNWWFRKLKSNGLLVKSFKFQFPHVKENWWGSDKKDYDIGNGFFVCCSKH